MIPDDNLVLSSRSHYRHNTVHIFSRSHHLLFFFVFNLKRSLVIQCVKPLIFSLPADIFYTFCSLILDIFPFLFLQFISGRFSQLNVTTLISCVLVNLSSFFIYLQRFSCTKRAVWIVKYIFVRGYPGS